jgi:hypothetical protein
MGDFMQDRVFYHPQVVEHAEVPGELDPVRLASSSIDAEPSSATSPIESEDAVGDAVLGHKFPGKLVGC